MTIPLHDSARQALLLEAIALATRLQTPTSETQKNRLSDRFQVLNQQLKAYAHPIQTHPRSVEAIPLRVRRCFVEAIALLPQFATLFQPTQVSGTLNSPSLKTFRPDPVSLNWPQDLAQLAQQFLLPESEIERLMQKQRQVQQMCDRRRQMLQALLEPVQSSSDLLKLFQQLFGPVPIPEAALSYVATDMQLIFALDYEGEELRSPLATLLSDDDCKNLRPFLQRLNQFNFRQLRNFPSFGPLDLTRVAPVLVQRMSVATGLEAGEVLRSLGQIIGLIPTAEAEKFLIHDLCGHFWQLALTSFTGDYACLAQADTPLRPGLAAYGVDGPLALREVFVWNGETIEVDEVRARYFFRGEVRQRLGHLLTHLIAEMLADLQEFKWGWKSQNPAQALPSSSVLADAPAKLDLTLHDVNFFLPRLLSPLLEFGLSVDGETLLEQELLLEQGALGAGIRQQLKGAIAHLQQLFWMEYLHQFPRNLDAFLANLLHLQMAINQLYTSPLAQQTPFQDVLLLFVGAYCSEDCYGDFWVLDDDLAEYFISCWRHLGVLDAESR